MHSTAKPAAAGGLPCTYGSLRCFQEIIAMTSDCQRCISHASIVTGMLLASTVLYNVCTCLAATAAGTL
jgi:hypothetical protein